MVENELFKDLGNGTEEGDRSIVSHICWVPIFGNWDNQVGFPFLHGNDCG